MTKRTKIILGALGVLLVGGTVAQSIAKNRAKATEVRIEAAGLQDLVASVTASGQVRPRTKVDISSDITGRITRLAVKDGDTVKEGQFLLQIDPTQFEAQVQRAEAALANARASAAQARANLLQARRDLERQQQILKTNAELVSTQEIERLETQLEVNEALVEAASENVKQAEASLKDARFQLSRTTIYAPMTGRVTRLNVEVGETAIMGTLNKDAATLLTISDMSILETKVKVDETDVSRIGVGDTAVVQIDAFPDTTFRGEVVEISNSSVRAAGAAAASTDQAIDYEVTVRILNPPPSTRPDFSSTAKIITDTRTQVLAIPIIALTVREDAAQAQQDSAAGPRQTGPAVQVGKRDVEGVFVVNTDNTVTFRPVKVGIAGEKHFEVIRGLEPGERIVAGTYQAIRELKDGQLVKEQEQTTPTVAKEKKE
ncbi:MAG: efflux RND transporter periplasmic adaptor subunit [Gemmatimonadota bacterium]|nr:efflux RND transporter periplasmic adaptor subunit [Gemmatimonadota bacterium]MDQ8151947.1 efflux RND transporter periplasmic adaptor subunit [Gemmatimonadota bacterium]MDQ8169751.1 efflux RND transporter periplasmic adaptor subunit [Gemmatimonadota bacterium]MDQ8178894.1 efflux RND transporter periplasmic adaptor subunit [Gemmatimonadota bacterium]